MGVQVEYARGDMAVATFDRVLVTYVRGPVTLEYLAEAHTSGKRLAKRFPQGIGSLTLVPVGASLPEKAVREQAREYTREADAWVRAGATVIGGEGFFASVSRSVVTAITLFSGGPPRRVFATSGPGIAWMAHELRVSSADLAPLIKWCELAMGDEYGIALSA